MLGQETITQLATALAPKVAPGLPANIPPQNVVQKVANTIIGLGIAVLGLAVSGLGGYLIVSTKAAGVWNVGLLAGGVVVVFIGGSVADDEIIDKVTRWVGIAQAVKALKGSK